MSIADQAEQTPPVDVIVEPADSAPVPVIKAAELRQLGQNLSTLFTTYKQDRRLAELKWMRNLRQYLGVYDPEIDNQLSADRSRAYPRVTRVKAISVLSRIMNLMFPGNERNWELRASPSPDMDPMDVQDAIAKAQMRGQEAGLPPQLDEEMVELAVQRLADERAEELSELIDDQLQELGGDQTSDYVALNRKVAQSGILYGLGVLQGPFVRTNKKVKWGMDPMTGQPAPTISEVYKPQFEFLPVWDFYPDMSAKSFAQMDGYFIRKVLSRAQVRALAERQDFFADQIRRYLAVYPNGNYRPLEFETELRTMGVRSNVNDMKSESGKYEIIIWNGPISGHYLRLAGVEVEEERLADDIESEVWMIDGNVIKADMNPWRKIGADVKTVHTFLFDEDDTSPVGNGLPNVIRDSQMALCAATRMLLDNASIVCGPNVEVNIELLTPGQDTRSIHAYKVWEREGTGNEASQPALRNLPIDSHMDELLKTIDLFLRFVDMETFVGPATGGEQDKGPSEPMRTAAGASMLRADAALPFKDIVRNFDSFTQSLITSLVHFNRKFNPDRAPEGDYNVIARGATSLIAKEIRGMQIDILATTLTPDDKIHVDERKFIEQRFKVRDLDGLLVPPDEAKRRQAGRDQQMAEQSDLQRQLMAAEIRKALSDSFKNIAQANKNAAGADAQLISAAVDILEAGMEDEMAGDKGGKSGSGKASGASKK